MNLADSASRGWIGPYTEGHEPSDFMGEPLCKKCHERWPCTVEDSRRTILTLIAGAETQQRRINELEQRLLGAEQRHRVDVVAQQEHQHGRWGL